MPYNYATTNPPTAIPWAFAQAPKIVAKTAAYTVKASESGTIFTTVGATAAVTFTLPKITEGPFMFWFVNCVDLALTISSETADTLLTLNDASTADSLVFNTTATRIGASAWVICDGTTIMALPLSGTGAASG
jgi:hypothetical protein